MRRTVKNNKLSIVNGGSIFRILSIFSLLLMIFGIGYFNQANAAVQDGKQEITAIEVSDYTITIKADGPMHYTLYKASDPFTAILDLQGIRLGKFNQRIFSKSAGITEIKPSQITDPVLLSRLEILLNNPSDIAATMKEGVLVVKIKEEELSLKEFTVSSTSAKSVIDIKFDKTADSIELVIKGDGNMPEPFVKEFENEVIIDIPAVKMATSLPSQLPMPIKNITHTPYSGGLRVGISFISKPDVTAFTFDDELIVDIPYKAPEKQKVEIARRDMTNKSETSKPVTVQQVAPATQPPQPADPKLISLDFQDADVTAILKLLTDVSGYNIIVHPDVKGKITMKLKDVQWEQALDIISKAYGLSVTKQDNIINVQPYSTYIAANENIAKSKESEDKAGSLKVKTYKISYADIYDIEKAIKEAKVLTSRGSVSIVASPAKDVLSPDPVDKFTSGEAIGRTGGAGTAKTFYRKRGGIVLVNDIPSVFQLLDKLIAELDKPSPQILVQARIVELDVRDEQALGIQWGLNYNDPSTLWSIGGTNPITGSKYVIDMPARPSTAIPTKTGSGFTFGLLNPAGTFSLDLKLSAIEQAQKGRIISKPSLLTVEKQKARIMQGFSIPYAEVSGSGADKTYNTEFKDIGIIIEVTSHLTNDNKLIMDILALKEELVAFLPIGPDSQAPYTTKIEGNTRAIMQSGETLVIGGIYQRIESDTTEGVPGLMRLPLLGSLFKNKNTVNNTKEILIFITPKLIDEPIAKK